MTSTSESGKEQGKVSEARAGTRCLEPAKLHEHDSQWVLNIQVNGVVVSAVGGVSLVDALLHLFQGC